MRDRSIWFRHVEREKKDISVSYFVFEKYSFFSARGNKKGVPSRGG
jgi:hypothetical protein